MTIADLELRFKVVTAGIEAKSQYLLERRQQKVKETAEHKELASILTQAGEVFGKIAELSRRDTLTKVEELITYALQTIFNDTSYKFFINEKEQKRNIVFDFLLQRHGGPPFPIRNSTGGGISNVISTFLGIILLILLNPNGRRFIALDERFKHVSEDNVERLAQVLRFFAEKLHIQFLILTHEPTLRSAGDKVYRVSNPKGESIFKEVVSNDVIE